MLLVNASSFLILVIAPFIAARWFGVAAIPLAMLPTIFLLQPIIAARVRQRYEIRTIRTFDAGVIACGSIALAAYAIRPGWLAGADLEIDAGRGAALHVRADAARKWRDIAVVPGGAKRHDHIL